MPPAAPLLPGRTALLDFTQSGPRLLPFARGRGRAQLAALALVLLGAVALAGGAAPAAAAVEASAGVAWKEAASDVEIDRAFTQARADARPLLLYWGASWCPPCNQLKATLFNRQDFIERSRAFVAVHVDGDAPGAQKLGTRFKVRGYPTMILFDPQGREITRLPGEVDAPQVMDVLQLGLAGGRPVRDVLADARARKPLTANDWRLLAFYSWDTDEQQLVPAAERPAVLAALAAECPPQPADVATRLWLKAQVARADAPAKDGKDAKADPAALRARLESLLADPAASRAQMDVLINFAGDLLKVAAPAAGPARQQLVDRYDAALQKLGQDATLSRADQLSTWIARVDLRAPPAADGKPPAKPVLPSALVEGLRAEVARHDREIRDGYERQAVITSAAYLLTQAGLVGESDALLQANLEKSHSPYYLMSALASNARKRGDNAAALRWYEEAWKRSVGPATRLQWGASYVTALVELAPQDLSRIEQAAGALIGEAGGQSNAFYERSARSLQRAGGKLQAWSAQQQAARGPVLQRLQQQLDAVCGKLDANDPQRGTCSSVLKPGAAGAHGAA